LRQFLRQTSILDRLCGSLCDAVTGRTDGQEMLEYLERENLFLMPLDNRREWFRYHQLFADFLQEELRRHHPDGVVPLHRQAAQWYLAHQLPEQSLHHALAGNDADLVARIGGRYFEVKLLSGEFTILKRWFEALPAQWHARYPEIGLIRAGVFLFSRAHSMPALAALMKSNKHWRRQSERIRSGSSHG
jgi:ATP/maltotriose-dependent transcriptional regulator MalT